MNDIKFRKMEMSDIPTVVKLRILQLKEEGATEDFDITQNLTDYFRNHIQDSTFVSYLAIDNDKIIATSGMSFVEKPPYFSNPTGKIGLLSGMYTLKEYRRKGIAKKLLEMVINEAKEYGCGTVYITSSQQGSSLYENCGFKRNNNFFQIIITD